MSSSNNEPTKPEWPVNVLVFHKNDKVEDILNKIRPTEDSKKTYKMLAPTDEDKYANVETGEIGETYTSDKHYSTKHYALLFAPGEYKDCRFEVGYYVQMAGLGKSPNDVKFVGDRSGPFIEALNKDFPTTDGGTIPRNNVGLCLDTFWRSAENFTAEKCQWAVSQAAPLRNVVIKEELHFGDADAYSSGGFLANAKIGNVVNYGANQQWFSRAIEFGGPAPNTGVWNSCYSGCTGNVPKSGQHIYWNGKLTDHVATIEPTPEVRVEKPFISMKMVGKEEFYELVVPSSSMDYVTGPHISGEYEDVRPFSQVKVCKPILPMDGDKYDEHDDKVYNDFTPEDDEITNTLQTALNEKKDLVLCPGIFFLTKPLIVRHPNQVILGLGLSTLVAPPDGSPCIRVEPNVAGVRIAGMTLEASLQQEQKKGSYANADNVRSLLEIGTPDVEDAGDPNNPTLLADVFTRVGGSNLVRQKVETDAMIRIHSGNVVGDNLWLWRADHVRLDKENGEKANDPNFPKYHQTRIWETDKDGKKVKKVDECLVKNALVVNGNDVKMYGLFCEHTTEHQLVWKGERGSVSFFQCELPYDVDTDFGENNFVGYYVDPSVKSHTGRGVGVYCNFQCFDVQAPHGLKVPDISEKSKVSIESPFTVYLSNHGGINNVIKCGDETHGKKVSKQTSKIERGWIGHKNDI